MADEMSSYFRRIKQQRQEQLEKEQAGEGSAEEDGKRRTEKDGIYQLSFRQR